LREAHLKEVLAETDHENEMKDKQIRQMTSQLESVHNELTEAKCLTLKYENEIILLKEGMQTPESANEDLLRLANEDLETKTAYYESIIVELNEKIIEYENMIYATNNDQESNPVDELPTKIKAPRLFCDICDEFDLHDTEDCPQQAMTAKEQAMHSMHNVKASTRTYCDDW
jgi:CAP-Gly domain-containing linker protein 1